MSTFDLVLIAIGCMLALSALAAGIVAWRGESGLLAMADTPTLSVAELFAELQQSGTGRPIEVVGTIECDQPLTAPYSEARCVAYSYVVTEEQEQIIGRPGSRRAREFEFGGHDDQSARVQRFYVRDATGRIAVDPAGAQIQLIETVARFEQYSGLGGSEREIWRHEQALPLGNRVYVLGYLTSDGGAPLITRDPSDRRRPYLISHKGEASIRTGARMKTYGLYFGSVLGVAGAVACFLAVSLT